MSGAAIQTWTDKKYGLSLSKQNGGGFYTVNGQQFVSFLNGPRMYNTIGPGILPEQDQQSTIAIVIGYSITSGYTALAAGYGPSSGWDRCIYHNASVYFGVAPSTVTAGGSVAAAYGSFPNNFTSPHILIGSHFDKRFNNGINFRINGVDIMQSYSYSSSGYQRPTAGSNSYVSLGADPVANYGYSAFACGDVLFCGQLGLAEIQKLEGYLAHKWNATSRLDNSHPYKGKKP